MQKILPKNGAATESNKRFNRWLYGTFLISSTIVITLFVSHFSTQQTEQPTTLSNTPETVDGSLSFPVSVDPERKLITENPAVDSFFANEIAVRGGTNGAHTNRWERLWGKLARTALYQNFASISRPDRTLVIFSGERREEIVKNFADILDWDNNERAQFLALVASTSPELEEGKFFPGRYTVPKESSPETLANIITNRFSEEILTRYTEEVSDIIPLAETLVIASLLEREAYDFTDMRIISGIIWNRLFADMALQLDATLQYAKGSRPTEPWWPRVVPNDKYIESPYNTYENKGLPPAPIANPSLDAILAALNPKQTDCLYYFHDRKGNFYCSVTYEEHVMQLKKVYGQGK